MSFGFSVGDFVALTQLAYTIVQNSRKACGVHGELTREVTSLHIVLQRLQREVEKPDSLISRTEDGRLEELQTIVKGCDQMLKVIDQVLNKYNGMSEKKRSVTRFRLKVQFGNGEMKDIGKIRQEMANYTSVITLFLNLLNLGSQGKVEEHMERNGEELRELRQSLNWITATLQASSRNREESILTSYGEDDKAIWKEFRRELLKEGFSSDELRVYKGLIKDYVMELGARGALDVPDDEEPIAESKDMAKEVAGARKGKEVGHVVAPVLESTPPLTEGPNSSSDKEDSTLPLDNHIDGLGQLVEDTTLGQSFSTPLGTLSSSASQISMDVHHMDDYPMTDKLDEAKNSDQGVLNSSTLISQESNTPDQPTLRSEHSSDSDVTTSEAEEEIITVQLKPVTERIPLQSPYGISVECSENESTLPPTIRKTRIVPEPVSIEEVEDEDFRPGAHPNCESVGAVVDEYGELDRYSDEDAAESSGYGGDDDSDEDDFSSSEPGPEDWRVIPAPLWREVERTRNPHRAVNVNVVRADESENRSGRLHRQSFESNVAVTNPMSHPESPSRVAESSEAHIMELSEVNLKQIPEDLTLYRSRGTSSTREFYSRSIERNTGNLWWLSEYDESLGAPTMELNNANLRQVPEDPKLYRSRATSSTRGVQLCR